MTYPDSIKQFVDGTVANPKYKIVSFTKSYCPYCQATVELIKKNYPDIPAEFVELDTRPDGPQIQEYLKDKTGQSTVPNTFIKEKHIGGNSELQALQSKGELPTLLA